MEQWSGVEGGGAGGLQSEAGPLECVTDVSADKAPSADFLCRQCSAD